MRLHALEYDQTAAGCADLVFLHDKIGAEVEFFYLDFKQALGGVFEVFLYFANAYRKPGLIAVMLFDHFTGKKPRLSRRPAAVNAAVAGIGHKQRLGPPGGFNLKRRDDQ